MKIDRPVTPGIVSTANRPLASSETKPQNSARTTEQVDISETSALLASETNDTPFDEARVAAIKLAIAEGKFQINTRAIADRLIDTAREMVAAQRRA